MRATRVMKGSYFLKKGNKGESILHTQFCERQDWRSVKKIGEIKRVHLLRVGHCLVVVGLGRE